MVQHTKYIQTPVTEYIAYDGKVFTDESKCREYERRGADPNPSVRFFNSIVELVPSDGMPIKNVLELATAYVVIDAKRARRYLSELNENYHAELSCDGLSNGSVYLYSATSGQFERLDSRIENAIRLYNGIITVCESALGASAMEIEMNWRARNES